MSILSTISEKVLNNQRLTFEEGLYLYESAPLATLGHLANTKNNQLNSGNVFHNINRHINPTNICVLSCKFCSFSRKPGDVGAYAFSTDEILEKAGEAVAQKATEVHMVGGLHPRWSFDHYLKMIGAIKDKYPQLHIKAFTAVELDWFAKKTRSSVKEVLQRLMEVGLGSIPGGGAEIFHPEVRDLICDTKVPAEQWLQTHETAHSLGLHSNATMLYGHIEEYKHRIDHMDRLRTLQDKTKGFNAFIPLSFQPHDNDMGISRYTFGNDDLRTIAVARLYLDNFQHIKSYWVMMGHDIAQLGLEFGANDLDGTVVEEKISKMAGGRSGMIMTQNYMHDLVERTNSINVERDTIYKPIRSFEKRQTNNRSELLGAFVEQDLSSLLQQAQETSQQTETLELIYSNDFKEQKTLHLKAAAHIDLDWKKLEEDSKNIETESLFITADEGICAASYFRALCILKKTHPKAKIHLEFETLPCLNPNRSGKASNQDPRFKIASVLKDFPVHSVILSSNYEQDFYDLLQTELLSSYEPKKLTPIAKCVTEKKDQAVRS